MTLADMRQKRAQAIARAQALRSAAGNLNRLMTEEENTQFDAAMTEADQMRSAIEREERLETESRSLTESRVDPIRQPAEVRDNAEQKPWNSFGEFLLAVRNAGNPGRRDVDPRLHVRSASGMNETVPADGGFLVQQDFSSEMLRIATDSGVLRSRVRQIPISANANGLKMNGVDETSRTTGSRFGGIRVFWAAEADKATATKAKFRQINLTLNKLIGLSYVTDELLQDATALESMLMQAFGEEIAFMTDDAILNGTGVGQPLGLLNSQSLVVVSKETGQASGTLVYENIVKMYARVHARARRNMAWLINQDIEPQLYTMAQTIGTGGVPVYLPPGGVSAQPYGTLFGRPVIPVEQSATLGTVGDVVAADLSQYLMIDKGGPQNAQSIHLRFDYDETAFRIVYRCDGQPLWHAPITPAKGNKTLSAFVALETR